MGLALHSNNNNPEQVLSVGSANKTSLPVVRELVSSVPHLLSASLNNSNHHRSSSSHLHLEHLGNRLNNSQTLVVASLVAVEHLGRPSLQLVLGSGQLEVRSVRQALAHLVNLQTNRQLVQLRVCLVSPSSSTNNNNRISPVRHLAGSEPQNHQYLASPPKPQELLVLVCLGASSNLSNPSRANKHNQLLDCLELQGRPLAPGFSDSHNKISNNLKPVVYLALLLLSRQVASSVTLQVLEPICLGTLSKARHSSPHRLVVSSVPLNLRQGRVLVCLVEAPPLDQRAQRLLVRGLNKPVPLVSLWDKVQRTSQLGVPVVLVLLFLVNPSQLPLLSTLLPLPAASVPHCSAI